MALDRSRSRWRWCREGRELNAADVEIPENVRSELDTLRGPEREALFSRMVIDRDARLWIERDLPRRDLPCSAAVPGRMVRGRTERSARLWTGVMMSLSLLSLSLMTLLLTSPVAGQVPEEDRPEIAVAVLRAVADSIEVPMTPDQRLWLREWATEGPAGWNRVAVPEPVVDAIRAAFPRAVLTDEYPELFLCPEGEEVRMPGNGCPIRDGGRIVSFYERPETAGPPEVHVSVTTTGCEGECTWMEVWAAVLERSPVGSWEVRGFEMRGIT